MSDVIIITKAIDKRDMGTLSLDFEAKHPRAPKKTSGKYRGGEFVPKSGPKEIPIPSAVRRSLAEFEEMIGAIKDHEEAAAIGPDGTLLFHKVGEESSVTIPVHFINRIIKTQGHVIFTHNHPGGWAEPSGTLLRKGRAFSTEDIEMAFTANLGEIRALSPGWIHRLQPGNNKRFDYRDWPEVHHFMTEQNEKLLDEWTHLLDLGEITVDFACAEHRHELMLRAAAHFGWFYSREHKEEKA